MISDSPVPGDYHIHSALCKHATGSVSEYIDAARARCLKEICFTDHAPGPDGFDCEHRMTLKEFPLYGQMVNEADNTSDVNVLFGVEADNYEGCESFLRSWLPAQRLDLVIGSIPLHRWLGI